MQVARIVFAAQAAMLQEFQRTGSLGYNGPSVQSFPIEFSGATFSRVFPQGSQPPALLSVGGTLLTTLRHRILILVSLIIVYVANIILILGGKWKSTDNAMLPDSVNSVWRQQR